MGQVGCRASRFSVIFIGVALEALLLASCGGKGIFLGQQGTTGTVTTNISDPPTCATSFLKAWVTVTRVRAHLSADADPSASGWIDLVDLRNNPVQVDLLSLASASCLLKLLGSTSGLPPGNYQQIRVILLSNAPASGTAMPSSKSNPCGNNGFNCVVLAADGSLGTLQLTSEADTGIKIPPGQIAGGGINLMAGQSADLDIDFDACSSIVGSGDGQFHLKPTLRAGEVSVGSKISGRVVDNSKPPNPIPNAIVLLEQPDSNEVDRKVFSRLAASDGTFAFCPATAGVGPSGANFGVPQTAPGNYDVVVAGQTTSGMVTTTYNATIVFSVPAGTAVGDIPLLPESTAAAGSTSPATITGQVTTAGLGSTAASADLTLSPLQQAAPAGGSPVQVTIPIFGATSQPPTLMTQSGSCPVGTDCSTYTLLVPGSNPQVGTFGTSGITFAAPASGSVFYKVEADASTCTPTSQTGNQLAVIAGGAPVTANFSFTGCQ